MTRHTFLAAALWSATLAPAFGLEAEEASRTPQSGDLERRVDAVFTEWDQPGSPGCALAVIHDGQVVYQRGYGIANLDHELPITPDSVFYLASVSKQFVAACIALLQQEGKLSLDDDVRKFVPELPDYGKTITLRHLVHHTSGLRDYLSLMQLAGLRWEDVHSNEELLALVCRQKELNFPPGDEYLYSNTGYFLMAEIVNRVSGKTLRQYADAKIFGPLGMQDTHFHDDHLEIVKHRATGYTKTGDGSYRIHFPANWDKVGSGGLYSTVADLARWDQNFYDPQVGGRQLLETISTPGKLNNDTVLDYAFGLVHGAYNGLKTVSHGGLFQGFRTVLLRFPDARFSVILLANLAEVDPTALARQVADVYLDARFASALDAFQGSYWSEELQAHYQIDRTDAGLVLQRPAAAPEPLVSTGKTGTFSAGTMDLVFSRDETGSVAGFVVSTGRARNARFTRAAETNPSNE